MKGQMVPLRCCDLECSLANGCRIGGYRCDRCGLWFCGDELETVGDRMLCGDCADEYREEQEDDTEGSEQGPEALPEAGSADERAD